MHIRVVQQQQEEHHLHHVLLHVLLHDAAVLSPIRKLFSAIFGMCKDSEVQQQKEREARRKDTWTLKQISQNLKLRPP